MDKKDRKVAVGVVVNAKGEFLLLHRRRSAWGWHGWEFPKGGLDGDSARDAVRREITEETGITRFRIVSRLKEKVRYDYPKYWRKATGFASTTQTVFTVSTRQSPRSLSEEFDRWAWFSARVARRKLKWPAQRMMLDMAVRNGRLVVFDLDGVLVNSKNLWADAFRRAFAEQGVRLSRGFVASKIGAKVEGSIRAVEEATGVRINIGLARRSSVAFAKSNFGAVRTVAGAGKALAETGKVARIVLLTNSLRNIGVPLLKRLGMDVFDRMLFSEDFVKKELALRLLSKEFNIPVKEIIYVGDMARDVRVARNAGCRILAVPGWSDKRTLKLAKPDFLANSIREVPNIVSKLAI